MALAAGGGFNFQLNGVLRGRRSTRGLVQPTCFRPSRTEHRPTSECVVVRVRATVRVATDSALSTFCLV